MEKKYDFKTHEKELEKFWEDNQIYKYQNGRDRKIFSIDISSICYVSNTSYFIINYETN